MNYIHPTVLSLSALTLTAWLPAQEASATSAPALVVKTTDRDAAQSFADMFADHEDLPKELAKDEHVVLTMGADGKLKVSKETGAAPYLSLRVQPPALMAIFDDRIQQARQQVGMMGGMVAAQLGMSPAEVNKLVDDVFAFPKQIATVAVDMNGSPDKGFDGTADIAATDNGWFAKFVGSLEPNKNGVPQMSQPDALLHLTTNMPSTALGQMMQPFLPFAVGGGAADKEERAKFTAMMQSLVAQFDGTLDFALLPEKAQKIVAGVADGPTFAKLLASDDYKTWRKANSEANPNADIEIKDGAATHRDVPLTKTVVDISTPMGDEKSTTFSGVAGSYLFVAGSEADANGVVDAILDDKIKRQPLAGGALLTLTSKIAEMVSVMSNGMAEGEGMPRSLDLALNRQASTLKLAFKVGM